MVNAIRPSVIHLICSSGFYGAERVVANLCNEMKNTELLVLCLAKSTVSTAAFRDELNESATEFICVKNRISHAIRKLLALKKSKTKFIIHAHGYKAIVISSLFNIISGCSIIVTQHGFTERNFKSRCYSWIDMALCRWADIQYVLCVSNKIYDRYLKFGVSSSRLISLPNGVLIPEHIDKQLAKYRIKNWLNISPTTMIVLYAGRLSEEKDPLLFIDIIKELQKPGLEFAVIMAGDGPLSKAVSNKIKYLNLENRIKTPGFVGDIDQLLTATDILLLTSKTEGTPMVLLEAMARKCAVISINVGGVAAIIKHNDNGILVDSRDPKTLSQCCQILLESEKIIGRLKDSAAKTIIEKYSLKSQISRYQQRYEELWR